MSKTSKELKQVPSRAWIKMSMVISVFVFGLLVPYNLTVEANLSPLFMAMGIGIIPMFFIFILVRKKLWKLSFDADHNENYFKLLIWSFLFSSILHTPILLINKIDTQKFVTQATVTKVANDYLSRDYIHPHLVLKTDDSIVKIRMSRNQLGGFIEGRKVVLSGIKGSLGYIIEAQVK
jgi:fumarate reductase subunit D